MTDKFKVSKDVSMENEELKRIDLVFDYDDGVTADEMSVNIDKDELLIFPRGNDKLINMTHEQWSKISEEIEKAIDELNKDEGMMAYKKAMGDDV